ncbi:hypothetical protein BDZ91DRAFT_753423 [Kalaharituber pfeilii]|nr:hypothetical protein BDZ91DRAFT_753423 [Kalaharituber pfeilii]
MLIASIGPELEGLGRGVRVGLLHSNISANLSLSLSVFGGLLRSSSPPSSFRFQTSHSIRTCAEVSRPLPHYLHSGLSAFPIWYLQWHRPLLPSSPARVVTLVPRRCSGQ